jgi:hypothetical protein
VSTLKSKYFVNERKRKAVEVATYRVIQPGLTECAVYRAFEVEDICRPSRLIKKAIKLVITHRDSRMGWATAP